MVPTIPYYGNLPAMQMFSHHEGKMSEGIQKYLNSDIISTVWGFTFDTQKHL